MGDLFNIENTLSFNSDRLVPGNDYDYVTRTSLNQGILQGTGYVNKENINQPGCWSLGLLQMDFFYRKKPWYAGQFVRKIVPKIVIPQRAVMFFTTLLNKQKKNLLSVLVRYVDETFRETIIKLPTKNGKIDFDFMEAFIAELEAERIAELEAERIAELSAYLKVSGFDNYELSVQELKALEHFMHNEVEYKEFSYSQLFDNIKQGSRLKKEDQHAGEIPFIMAGTTNTGLANYISNPVASFPENSITIDIFGNTFYRNYAFGAGDDTGVYWNSCINYSKEIMLFFATAMEKSVRGKFSYGKKLRSSQSYNFKIAIPVKQGKIDFAFIEKFISAIQKLVIKDVILYADRKIKATKNVVSDHD